MAGIGPLFADLAAACAVVFEPGICSAPLVLGELVGKQLPESCKAFAIVAAHCCNAVRVSREGSSGPLIAQQQQVNGLFLAGPLGGAGEEVAEEERQERLARHARYAPARG